MKLLRTVIFYIVLLSLLTVPYSFLAYLCYLGLCGGSPATIIAKSYTGFYGYFTWIYPLIVIVALFLSRMFKKTNLKLSLFFLVVPLVCLLPFLYVEFKAWQIQAKHDSEQQAIHQVKPQDYSCAPGKFIRHEYSVYYFYDYNLKGDSGSMSAYYSLQALQEGMESRGIQLESCKNQAGETL